LARGSPERPVSAACPLAEREALRRERERAVWQGARWMARYLRQRGRFRAVGGDSVDIFVELGLTAASPRLREMARREARYFARRLVRGYLRPGGLTDRQDWLDAVSILSEAEYLGIDARRLLPKVMRRFRHFAGATAIYDLDVSRLERANEEQVFSLLLDAYALERAALRLPGRFPVSFGLREVLAFLARRPLVTYAEDRSSERQLFFDHAYLATHIGFILNDYGRIRLRWGPFAWVERYLRDHGERFLELGDVELSGELSDLLRSAGRTEVDDPLLCAGTRFLLRSQAADGSWGPWREEDDPYDVVHYTWTAVHGLRERIFLEGTSYERRLHEILDTPRP
jgi:hypothetical protein